MQLSLKVSDYPMLLDQARSDGHAFLRCGCNWGWPTGPRGEHSEHSEHREFVGELAD